MKRGMPLALVVLLLAAVCVSAADYRVESLAEPPPATDLAKDIADRLAPQGIRVIRGEDRTIADLWFVQGTEVPGDFEVSAQVLYPFQAGQLVGVMRFPRRGSDFRDQRVNRGVYTLRYAQQPVDGNHVGTSPTRDFLLLVSPEIDQAAELIAEEKLNEASAEAIGATHPAMLCLQAAPGGQSDASLPALRHDEDRDWWVLQAVLQATRDGQPHPLPVSLVVVGHAEE